MIDQTIIDILKKIYLTYGEQYISTDDAYTKKCKILTEYTDWCSMNQAAKEAEQLLIFENLIEGFDHDKSIILLEKYIFQDIYYIKVLPKVMEL